MRMQEVYEYLFQENAKEAIRIAQLQEAVFDLQNKTFRILDTLSDADKTIIEGYIYGLQELELHTVVCAYNKGLEKGKEIGKNEHHSRCHW